MHDTPITNMMGPSYSQSSHSSYQSNYSPAMVRYMNEPPTVSARLAFPSSQSTKRSYK